MKKTKRLALLAVPALFTVALATPAHAMSDDGDDTPAVEQTSDATSADIQTVMNYAYAQLGKPYVFAAAGPNAFDCSGLTMAAYRQIGIDLPHLSFTQATMGREVSKADIRAGDLLFFYGGQAPAQSKGHVAIAVSATHMISAPRSGVPVHLVPIPGNVQSVRRYVA
jgi:cell wall-associated NlpC family hydrolase